MFYLAPKIPCLFSKLMLMLSMKIMSDKDMIWEGNIADFDCEKLFENEETEQGNENGNRI